MDPAEAVDAPAPGERIRWALLGVVAGFAASVVIGGAVVAAGGWDPDVPAGLGSDVGRTVMQVARGLDPDDGRIPLVVVVLLQVPLWAGLLGAVAVGRTRGLRLRRDLGLALRPVDVPVGLAVGIALQLVVVPALYVPIFRVLGERDVAEAARSLVGRADGTVDVAALVVITLIGAPIVEELVFRGLLHRALREVRPAVVATAISSVVFAAGHLQPLQFPALVVVGVAHAVLVDRTGRLGPAIVSHAAFNAVTVVVLLGGG